MLDLTFMSHSIGFLIILVQKLYKNCSFGIWKLNKHFLIACRYLLDSAKLLSKHCANFSAPYKVARTPNNHGKNPFTRLFPEWMIPFQIISNFRTSWSSLNNWLANARYTKIHWKIKKIKTTKTTTTKEQAINYSTN